MCRPITLVSWYIKLKVLSSEGKTSSTYQLNLVWSPQKQSTSDSLHFLTECLSSSPKGFSPTLCILKVHIPLSLPLTFSSRQPSLGFYASLYLHLSYSWCGRWQLFFSLSPSVVKLHCSITYRFFLYSSSCPNSVFHPLLCWLHCTTSSLRQRLLQELHISWRVAMKWF